MGNNISSSDTPSILKKLPSEVLRPGATIDASASLEPISKEELNILSSPIINLELVMKSLAQRDLHDLIKMCVECYRPEKCNGEDTRFTNENTEFSDEDTESSNEDTESSNEDTESPHEKIDILTS